MPVHRFSFPTRILFGAGVRRGTVSELLALGARRPLVVTDRGLAALPLTAEFMAELSREGVEPGLFGGVEGNPVAAQVRNGVAAYRAHRADSIVGFGGGASLDVAKAVALMAVHPGDIMEYAWDHPAVRPVNQPLPPIAALPTTSGTGSEVGRSVVISDDVAHIKKVIFSPPLLPKVVLADPELTLALPPAMTAATGMDALTHNVESYLSTEYHPICDGVALEGARLAARALAAAVRDGANLAVRSDMMMASMMGAIAFQKDLGAVHSCAHALSAVVGMHHGLANAIMIDFVMRFNAPSAPEKMSELARVCGAGSTADDFVSWLRRLKAEIGIPATLAPAGVSREQIPQLVEIALADSCHRTNPRPCARADFEALFAAAL
jgi:alcohol dehydrogenase class IV